MAIFDRIEKIDERNLCYDNGNSIVGQPAVPNLSVYDMQMSVENLGRHALMPKLNEVVDVINDSYSKEEADSVIDRKIKEIGAGDMAKTVYDPKGKQQDIFDYAETYADSKTAALRSETTSALAAVSEKLGRKELLWENATPTTVFPAQTINVHTAGFDDYIIEYAFNAAQQLYKSTNHLSVGYNVNTVAWMYNGTGSQRMCRLNEETADFTVGYFQGAANNNYAIPLRIYGINY